MCKDFECKRCGGCCGIVPFSRIEYKRIRDIVKRMNLLFVKTKVRENIVYYEKEIYKKFSELKEAKSKMEFNNKSSKIICPFLSFEKKRFFFSKKKSSCLIYDLRPQICKDFGKGGHKYLMCPNNQY